MRISDWSSDVCSSDLLELALIELIRVEVIAHQLHILLIALVVGVTELRLLDLLATHLGNHRVTATAIERIDAPERKRDSQHGNDEPSHERSEEHTSELQSLMRISYAVLYLKTKNKHNNNK